MQPTAACAGSVSHRNDRLAIVLRDRFWPRLEWVSVFVALIAVMTWRPEPWCAGAVCAGEVRLNNGTVLQGRPSTLLSIGNPLNPQGPVPIYNVVMVQTDWQRYFVPARQVPDKGVDLAADHYRYDEFTVPQLKGSRSLVVQTLGTVTEIQPFDKNGHRTVSLATGGDPLVVVQAITKLHPEFVSISALKYQWDFGLSLSQLPQDTVLQILHNPVVCKPDNPQDRMARARFCVQAGWYPQADEELATVATDFPDLAQQAEAVRQELRQLFARDVLRELARRRDCGQFQLAEESARQIPATLGAGISREVEQFLGAMQQSRDSVNKAKALLADWQAKLPAGEQATRVNGLRSLLEAEIDVHGMGRLQPFLQAETDPALSVAEKLALAYSGWVLGTDGADEDLDRAERLWDARFWIREYLRAGTDPERQAALGHLRSVEGLGATTVRRLLQQLPPVRDAEGVSPGVPSRITLPGRGEGAEISYHVTLPPEYSPQFRYPLIVALHPGHNSIESTLGWWAGVAEQPGWASRRGYIVIAPEYLAPEVSEYNFNPVSHAAVLESLRDARLRFAVDPDRVYLSGHGVGGDAAWDMGLTYPDEFAGVIPIGGVCPIYGHFILENGRHTAWYVIRGEKGRDQPAPGRGMTYLMDIMLKGAKFDVIYCLFIGRGNERFPDELAKLFDWMELHRRPAALRKFEYRALRETDNHFGWASTSGLPPTPLLTAPPGSRLAIKVNELVGDISVGNTVSISSPAKTHRLRLFDDLVDFEKRVTISVQHQRRFNNFLKPDVATMLDDFGRFGDRRRIAQVVLEF